MPDISMQGPFEGLTLGMVTMLQPAFRTFPNHDADGNVIGIPVYSFFTDVTEPWPGLVCRMHSGAWQRMAIGNAYGTPSPLPGTLPSDMSALGTMVETLWCPAAILEVRLMARSEVERERMSDWLTRIFGFNLPSPDGSDPLLQQLGQVGITVQGLAGDPVLPEIDPAAARPQGMPPWPGQMYFRCQVELSLLIPPLPVTVQVEQPVVTVISPP